MSTRFFQKICLPDSKLDAVGILLTKIRPLSSQTILILVSQLLEAYCNSFIALLLEHIVSHNEPIVSQLVKN